MDSQAANFEALRDRHTQLEKAIAAEMKHRPPDQFKLQEMKKEKLHIKEQLADL